MVDLLTALNARAKRKNSGFLTISNGGYNLYSAKAKTRNKMLNAIDGVIIEEAFTHEDQKAMRESFSEALSTGKKAFSIEYEDFKGDDDILSYRAPSIDLDRVPRYLKHSEYDVNTLSEVQDFLVILDPGKYKSKKAYLQAIKNTDYDLVFVDLFYDDQNPLTLSDVKSLKKKKHSGTRKVCAYLSIGEAEDYRYYWKKRWNKKSKRPSWIVEENPEWKGNYKVKYWKSAWKKIVYKYLDKIVAKGFDGVYLDVIDAYEYFEER